MSIRDPLGVENGRRTAGVGGIDSSTSTRAVSLKQVHSVSLSDISGLTSCRLESALYGLPGGCTHRTDWPRGV